MLFPVTRPAFPRFNVLEHLRDKRDLSIPTFESALCNINISSTDLIHRHKNLATHKAVLVTVLLAGVAYPPIFLGGIFAPLMLGGVALREAREQHLIRREMVKRGMNDWAPVRIRNWRTGFARMGQFVVG